MTKILSMKKYLQVKILLTQLLLSGYALSQVSVNKLTSGKTADLWYRQPAVVWLQALPIGNGSMGAMVFGKTDLDRIQFNENSLCSGTLDSIGSYQPFGNLFINWHQPQVQDYKRKLSLDSAIQVVTYATKNVHFKRELFASHPDSAIIMQFTADQPGAISVQIALKDAHHQASAAGADWLSFSGKLSNGLAYEAQLKCKVSGGSIHLLDSGLRVSKADTLTLILVAGTSFNINHQTDFLGKDPHQSLLARQSHLQSASYEKLKERHVKDYQNLFGRVKFSLGTDVSLPTDERLQRYSQGSQDLAFEALLFHYGRFLLISSSREGGLPANLQGIWNDSNHPAWYSQYTTNINVQMNYWPAEVTNLSECHLPLLGWIENLASIQKQSSDPLLKVKKGWVAYSTNNIMGGASKWRLHRPGSAWLSQHFWEHYAFTEDTGFLRKRAYPMLKEIVQYWQGHVIRRSDGLLITPDGWSPEHGPFKNERDTKPYPGVSYDQQIVYDLFTNYLDATKVLKTDPEFRKKVKSLRRKLLGPRIGRWGQLQEWMDDWDDPDDHHRHISHLFAVYPGRQIDLCDNPTLAEAAIKSMDARGNVSTGWSTAWKMNVRARLGEGDKVRLLMQSLLKPAGFNSLSGERSGLYDNLFDAHPPFQIDGNFGYTAAIAEMLLQSQNQCITLLPALPSAWKAGEISGLKARGNVNIDIIWNQGKLVLCKLRAVRTGYYRIRYGKIEKVLFLNADRTVSVDGWLRLF